ncbi:MAG: putative membrane protein [Spirosomataceae bacterium]|jgi:uncharacterized membrane protein
MKTLLSIISYLLIGIHALLAFLLLFENSVEIPFWLNPIGRMHPLLLHLPIGLLFLTALFWIFRKEFPAETFHKVNRFVLALTAISAATAALMGFFLSTEAGYTGETLTQHKWVGVTLSFVCYSIYTFYDQLTVRKNAYPVFLGIGSVLIIITGHLGANLTHGEEFLFEAFTNTEKEVFTVENTMYEAVVFPIFEAKCVACHNDNKVKGELNMSSIAKMLKGGENGTIWVAGDAASSHFIQRANLPLDDKEHMPPRGKSQLTDNEILILTAWVNSGADTKLPIRDYSDDTEIKLLALNTLKNDAADEAQAYDFSAASASTVEEVNTPFCTVEAIATGSPALKANFYVTQRFDRKVLENLSKVSEQLIELNLSKMPVTDEDLKVVGQFKNLERLILNSTEISGSGLKSLSNLKNLSSLAVSNTKVKATDLEAVFNLPNLKEIFVWSTKMSEQEIDKLNKRYKNIAFDKGYIPDASETITINAPVIKNEERILVGKLPIVFTHPLPNVTIRYTTDGTNPDSLTGIIYKKPFIINEFTTVKAIAVKKGWLASQVVQQSFYKSNFKAKSIVFLNSPNPQYKGDGAKTLIDLQLGEKDNFKDLKWVGFKETPLESIVEFDKEALLKSITLNYLVNISGYIMPPSNVSVSGSNDKSSWKLINQATPEVAKTGDFNKTAGLNLSLSNEQFKYYKIVAKPLAKLPKWHQGAGEPAWIFVDEIFFN